MNTTGWWNAFSLPFQFTTQNYFDVLTRNNPGTSFLNSLIISIPATVIPIMIAAFAAYAFAWMDFPAATSSSSSSSACSSFRFRRR